jgi:hypothetical protein
MGRLATYVVFSIVVAAILAGILPALALLYVAIAVAGGFLLLAGRLPGRVSRRREQDFRPLLDGYISRVGTAFEHARAEAEAVRREPWHVDAVVDMRDVERKWGEANLLARPSDAQWLIVPNPYFVLPLPKLVGWNFASAVEVREALRWADSPTPPVRWRNPEMIRVVGLMGWPETEVWARIGLFFWRMPAEAPSPSEAEAEAGCRARGSVFDVPRPASLN